MKELKELANITRKSLKLEYDSDSIKVLENYIEEQKADFPEDKTEVLITACGAFLGQCIIENYGGNWKRDNNNQDFIAFDHDNGVFPFAKVSKQFTNGLDDSIHSFYLTIPRLFKLKPKLKKKWWQF